MDARFREQNSNNHLKDIRKDLDSQFLLVAEVDEVKELADQLGECATRMLHIRQEINEQAKQHKSSNSNQVFNILESWLLSDENSAINNDDITPSNLKDIASLFRC